MDEREKDEEMVLLLPTRCKRLEQAIFLSEILRIFACPKTGLLTGHKDCISPVGRGGGGLLPHGSSAGLFRPTGSCFGDSDQGWGIIFKPFTRAGRVILQMHGSLKILSAILTIEWGIKKIAIFRTGYHFPVDCKPYPKRV